MIDLEEIRKRTVSVSEYIPTIDEKYRTKFTARRESYELNQNAIRELKKEAENYSVVVFSAGWCKDCANNVPVLDLVSEATGLEVRVFGNMKTDPFDPKERWKIPPSPPEARTFAVEKLPWIVVFDESGNEIGKIIENPEHTPSLEEELLYVIRKR